MKVHFEFSKNFCVWPVQKFLRLIETLFMEKYIQWNRTLSERQCHFCR